MTGFLHKHLVNMIFIVLLLLALCIAVDYATNETTVTNMDQADSVLLNDSIVVNDTYYVSLCEDEGNAKFQKVVTVKPKLPLVTITAKPSVRSNYAYKWYTRTWVNYCPNCKHYNVLLINPKHVPERELTCKRCSSDFCGVTGKEKYSWSHVYLRRA